MGAAGSCLGSCAGQCVSTSCCALALSGSTSSSKASKCLLLWLQAFTAILSLLLAWNPTAWLPDACSDLGWLGKSAEGVGICECGAEGDACWGSQVVYRVQASAVVVYLLLVVLVASGCGSGAAHAYPVMKFFVTLGLAGVFMFLPNPIFASFGVLSDVASAAFLVVQTVPLMDLAYQWNERWSTNALRARTRSINLGHNSWHVSMLAASALLLLGALAGAIGFYASWPSAWGVITFAFAFSLVLLVVSITEWCRHGSLLTSSVMVAYAVWLSYAAINVSPETADDETLHTVMKWMGMAICAFTLSLLALLPSKSGAAGAQQQLQQPLEEGGGDEGGSGGDEVTAKDFAMQCGMHAAASMYVAAALAPSASPATFGACLVALSLALSLYGWSLVAPMLLTGRDF